MIGAFDRGEAGLGAVKVLARCASPAVEKIDTAKKERKSERQIIG
jgi:hypothetical protein